MRMETIRIQRFGGGSLLRVFVLGAAPCLGILLLLTGAAACLSVPPGHGPDRSDRASDPAHASLVGRRRHRKTTEPSLCRDAPRPSHCNLTATPSAASLMPLWWGMGGWLCVGSGLWIYSKLCPIEIKVLVPSVDSES